MDKTMKIGIAAGVVLIVLAIVGGFRWLDGKNKLKVNIPAQKACTQEAKICPDGSAVGRTGSNCEFATCPAEKIGIANPASVNCEQKGGTLEIRTSTGGGQIGICKFSDGSECEEWKYFRGECKPGRAAVAMNDKIVVNSPIANAKVSSPISVSGKARGTWFFEGSFPVAVYDSNDKLLGQTAINFTPTSSSDTWMTENFVNFQGSIIFSQPTTDSGYLLFKKDNPSGNPELDESLKLLVGFVK